MTLDFLIFGLETPILEYCIWFQLNSLQSLIVQIFLSTSESYAHNGYWPYKGVFLTFGFQVI